MCINWDGLFLDKREMVDRVTCNTQGRETKDLFIIHDIL